MTIVEESVRVVTAEVGFDTTDGKVHLCHLPCCRVRVLSEHRNVAQIAAVVLNELCALDEHTARSAAGVIYASIVGLQHMIYHLAPNGKIGMVLANGALSSQSGGEGEIRQNIVNADLVDCIVAMPSQLFYTTPIPVSLWFLSKNKKQKGKTLFIDARKLGTMVTRKLREFTDTDIAMIADAYKAYCDGTLDDQKGFCAVVDTEEIAKQDYVLTPGRYVGIEEQEDDGEPFEEKMTRLTGELSELFAQSHALEEEIRQKLEAIGYGI